MFRWLLPDHYSIECDAHAYSLGAYWLPFEVAFLLAYTSFALLLAYSISSTRHWAIRVGLPLGVLVGTVLIPAEEVFIIASIQGTMVLVIYSCVSRFWEQFGIRDIMVFTVYVAVAVVCVNHIPASYFQDWRLWAIGAGATAVNLTAFWACNSKSTVLKCFVTILPYNLLLVPLLWLHSRQRRWANWSFRVGVLIVVVPVAVAFADLLYKAPIPAAVSSGPNSLSTLLEVGQLLGDQIDVSDPAIPVRGPSLRGEVFGRENLGAVLKAYEKPLFLARSMSGKPGWLEVDYEWKYDGSFKGRMPHRNGLFGINSLLRAEARLALIENRLDDVLMSIRDGFELNQKFRVGGLPLDVRQARHCEFELLRVANEARNHLDGEQLKQLMEIILSQKDGEHYENVKRRRRAWEDRVPRWHEQLMLRYLEFGSVLEAGRVASWNRHNCAEGLLVCELAIRRYVKQNGHLPRSLHGIPKTILSQVPHDPHGGKYMRYCVTADGYKLYSVGYDNQDDGGEIKTNNNWNETSDLTLDSIFN